MQIDSIDTTKLYYTIIQFISNENNKPNNPIKTAH